MENSLKQETAQPGGEVQEQEPEHMKYRQYHGPMKLFTRFFAAGLCLFILLYVGGALPQLGFYLLRYQFVAIFVGGMLFLIFLLIPPRKGLPRDKLPWYDILLILAGLAPSVYIVMNAYDLAFFQVTHANTLQLVLGFMMLATLMEALRRTIGLPMVAIALLFVIHARWSYLLPEFAFSILEQPWTKIIANIYLSVGGMFGLVSSLGANIIYAFIAFGIFFMKVGGGDFFLKLALCLTGRLRGGPAKAAIVGSALFGTLSGSPAGNVAVTGSVTIPMMKKTGYSPIFAGAVESVASTGGQIMPPIMGTTAFIMAVLLQVSYATVALAAVIPAALYYIALFVQTDLRAAKTGLHALPPSDIPSLRETLKRGWEFIFPIVGLVVLLFVLRYPPPLAGVYSIIFLIVISMFRKRNRLNLTRVIDSLEATSRSMLIISPALAAAGIIITLVGMTGLGPLFASALVEISGGNMIVLFILAAIASYVLGMGGALTVSYILLAILVAPALEKVGVPLMVAHFFILYMGMTMFFTPPVCPVVFIASGIADAPAFPIGWQSMRLGIVTYLVPFILIYNPALILMGETPEIILAVITAIIGVYALSVGVERYLFTKTNWLQTILAIGAGITMMAPGLMSDFIGIGLLVVVVLWQLSTRRRISLAEPAMI